MDDNKNSTPHWRDLSELSDASIQAWKTWCVISNYQKDIFNNYKKMLPFIWYDFCQRFFQLVPTILSQTINPWAFSLFHFTKEIKGSPVLESKILTEVAGYGSQLGTIMDVLEIVGRECGLEAKLEGDDEYKFFKLKELVSKIDKAKKDN